MIKKIVLALLFFNLASIAQATDYICVPKTDLSSKTMQVFSVATGQNLISEQVYEYIIEKNLQKQLGGEIKAQLDGFSASDLKKGKFKSLELSGERLNIKGVNITEIKLKTLCDYNYVTYDDTLGFDVKQDLPARFSARVSEADLNKLMLQSAYQELLKKANFYGDSLKLFRVKSTNVKIIDNKLLYIVKLIMPLIGGEQEVVIASRIEVIDGKIELADAEISSDFIKFNIGNMAKVINFVNPLAFSLQMLENNNVNIKVSNIQLGNGEILINGVVTILEKN